MEFAKILKDVLLSDVPEEDLELLTMPTGFDPEDLDKLFGDLWRKAYHNSDYGVPSNFGAVFNVQEILENVNLARPLESQFPDAELRAMAARIQTKYEESTMIPFEAWNCDKSQFCASMIVKPVDHSPIKARSLERIKNVIKVFLEGLVCDNEFEDVQKMINDSLHPLGAEVIYLNAS